MTVAAKVSMSSVRASAAQLSSRSETSASCASTSSAEPKWVIATRSGLQPLRRSIESCQASTSMSGGGAGGIVRVCGLMRTPAASPTNAVPSCM